VPVDPPRVEKMLAALQDIEKMPHISELINLFTGK